ncbi:MAG: ABC-F family ATP-binding cassette domain-containing protein [Alphaproteobacteria bacterium]|nr:ABC-F family ATP-binding cassette domain-containing protein [Alphaproteobacteria bacterium]
MSAPLLQLRDIRLTFGGAPLLDGAEFVVSEGDRLAVVGRNGSGKSTLLRIAGGLAEADSGERFADPAATIRYLPQEPDLSGFPHVRAYAEAGLAPGDDPHRATYLLNALGLSGDEAPGRLSGGEARRAALARVLAPSPDILLLDEPTNHLDLPAIEWLEAELGAMRSALVLISHDRRFLERLSRHVVWLDRGRTRRLDKGFAFFEAWRDEVLAQEELDRHKLDRQIAREEDWLRYGVTARRKRNQGRLAGLQNLRTQRREQVRAQGTVAMAAADGPTSGTRVIEAKGVSKAFGETTIVRDFSIRILRGDRVGVVGPNGAGKTTLLKLLTGQLAPDGGSVVLGANVEVAWLDQQRATLDPEASVADTLTGGGSDTLAVGGVTRHVAGYLREFLFAPQQMRQKVRALSGGERGRLLLARAFARPSSLLVLDEPTNDLDLETLDVLQEALAAYAGTVLLVSHDRDFLDRVATSVLMAEGQGRFVEYAGGYADMVAQRGEGVTAKAVAKTVKAESAAAPAVPRAASRKMSFKDKHALETLPGEIARLDGEIAALEARLADGSLYVRDPKAYEAASTRLTAARAEHEAAEHRWLELELLRDELEA